MCRLPTEQHCNILRIIIENGVHKTINSSLIHKYTEQKKKGILNLVLNYAFFI